MSSRERRRAERRDYYERNRAACIMRARLRNAGLPVPSMKELRAMPAYKPRTRTPPDTLHAIAPDEYP